MSDAPPVADRVLEALGPGIVDLAGPLLPPLLGALVSRLEATDSQLQPDADRPSPALFDLTATAAPHWLGQAAGLAVPSTLTDVQARAYVAGRGVSRRGTVTALRAAVAATLTGTRSVLVLERDGGPYQVTVVTYEAETPDGARTTAAAATEKPVGLLLTHTVRRGITWGQVAELGLTWSSIEAYTWDELGLTVPQS